jgi:hypothetical protein
MQAYHCDIILLTPVFETFRLKNNSYSHSTFHIFKMNIEPFIIQPNALREYFQVYLKKNFK